MYSSLCHNAHAYMFFVCCGMCWTTPDLLQAAQNRGGIYPQTAPGCARAHATPIIKASNVVLIPCIHTDILNSLFISCFCVRRKIKEGSALQLLGELNVLLGGEGLGALNGGTDGAVDDQLG